MALTFDDGPSRYTSHLLDLLRAHGARATFFINGNNYASPLDGQDTPWPDLLHRMHASGHQLASHTWTHQNLDSADRSLRIDQMVFNEMALRNIFGFFPTYMRPPYGECGQFSGCQADMASLGYHVVNWDVDTRDWAYQHDIRQAMDVFSSSVSGDAGGNSYIVLSHDVHEQTVYSLAEYMILEAKRLGYELVTVGECLNDPAENWYDWEERW